MNKIIFIVVGIILLGGAGYFLMGDKSPEQTMEATSSPTVSAMEEKASESITEAEIKDGKGDGVMAQVETKSFTVVGTDFDFDLKEIKVKKGDKVKITFKNSAGFHDWKIDEFNLATKKLQAGQEDAVEFIADKAGTFEYYCSVGSHRAKGMKGSLIVE